MKQVKRKLSQTMEDYLEAIFVLSKSRGYARTSEIAKNLHVSPSSVVEMIGRISALKLVVWKRYEGVYLTPEGRVHGEMIHIRHETLRRFFEFIGVSREVANAEACVIEHELSTITTAAIGNLVRFLETPTGQKTCQALKLFIKLQDTNVPFAETEGKTNTISPDEIQETIRKNGRQYQVLSTLTRHDLLNSLTALYGYLDILRDQEPGSVEIVSRIEQTTTSMYRQISGSGDLLIPGSSTRKWFDIGNIIDSAAVEFDLTHISVENNLHGVEIYVDPLISKVIYNLLENSIRHGKTANKICCGYFCEGSDLVWFISDNGTGIQDTQKDVIFRPSHGSNSGLGLYLSEQILSSCKMRIEESGEYGNGASFCIRVPPPLYRHNKIGFIDPIQKKECKNYDSNINLGKPVSEQEIS